MSIFQKRKAAQAPEAAPSGEAISPYFQLPPELEDEDDLAAAPAAESRLPAIKIVAGLFCALGLMVAGLVVIQHFMVPSNPQAAGPVLAALPPAPTAADAAAQASAAADAPGALTPAASSDPVQAAKPAVDMAATLETNRAAAAEMLRAQLPDTSGALFRNVKTNLSSDNGEILVDFCGEVNVVDPAGAYVGFQRFVSSMRAAKVEQGAAPGDFAEAWNAHCNGQEGPKIWR